MTLTWWVVGSAVCSVTLAEPSLRRPANPANVTFYNLRPRNLSTNIIEKDSADAMGDIFFYITDRLLVPYACRNAPNGTVPWFCESFQKRLQTNDQVYTKLTVEVDSSYGGCRSGNESCSTYADCNPVKGSEPIVWGCDCHDLSLRSPRLPSRYTSQPHSVFESAPNYWNCSFEMGQLCPTYGVPMEQCLKCANDPTNTEMLNEAGCTPEYISKTCAGSFENCETAIRKSGCHLPATNSSECRACAKNAYTEQMNCSEFDVHELCSKARPCNATGMLEVSTRYCESVDPSTGLCIGCADGCGYIWDHWKSEISNLGGIWYSTTKEGNCLDSTAPSCTWRVVNEIKTVNATCANYNVHRLVEARGENCFNQCPQPTNTTSDCWILCFFKTVLARDPLELEHKTGAIPMTRNEIESAWLQAFESDDPSEGGCAPVIGDFLANEAAALRLDLTLQVNR